jgi:hypothetical protein
MQGPGTERAELEVTADDTKGGVKERRIDVQRVERGAAIHEVLDAGRRGPDSDVGA